jgi:arabinose-5-phosphate isomerase
MLSFENSAFVVSVTELLRLEANAIYKAANQLCDQQVNQAILLLRDCKGKVVLIGVGKSGIVAQKIAATLTSIGTLAISLHPCDALHGDLGIVTSNDVVVMLSNSGETDELLAILPHLKLRQVSIIVIIGNLNSTLARHADVVLDASVDREACPLNLAPTTSTTVAMAIGDALAMTVMQMKGLTPEAFAINHPSGRLGKRLTLKVGDVMLSGVDNPILIPSASWIKVVSAITQGGAGAVNIVNEENQLLGLVTDGDLRRWMQKTNPNELATLTAQKIMTIKPVAVTPDILAYDALKLMEERPSQISVLPVVDTQQRCLGLIRLHDLLRNGL